jgi:hypothetical protein
MEPTRDELIKKFNDFEGKAIDNKAKGKKFVLYCYYSGHGGLENTTKLMLSKGNYFALEKVL